MMNRVNDKAGRGHQRMKWLDGIHETLNKTKIVNIMNKRTCQNRLMDVN